MLIGCAPKAASNRGDRLIVPAVRQGRKRQRLVKFPPGAADKLVQRSAVAAEFGRHARPHAGPLLARLAAISPLCRFMPTRRPGGYDCCTTIRSMTAAPTESP
jgi:hypothetical protein